MDCITAKLEEMGIQIDEQGDSIKITRTGDIQRTNIKTMPYPGFPHRYAAPNGRLSLSRQGRNQHH